MWSTILNIGIINQFSFGLFSLFAFLFGSFAFWKKAREEHYDEHESIDLILLSVIWGIVGARLVFIGLNFADFGLNLLYWFAIWSKPGLNWIGLYSGALIALIYFCRRHKLDIFKTMDLAVIGLALAQSLINLGLFLSGVANGATTKLPVGVVFPNTFEPRHPIGLYGFVLWLGVFFLLWWLEGKYRRFEWYQKYKGDSLPGFLFFVYLVFLGLIGIILTLFSQSSLIIYGINVDLALRISLVIFGAISIFARSGFGAKLGLDQLAWLNKR